MGEGRNQVNPGKNQVFPVIPDEIWTDRDDWLDMLYRAAIDAKNRRTRSIIVVGHRRLGKTELFLRTYNRLFFEQDEVVPIYFSFEPCVGSTPKEFADIYIANFLRQYLAFRKKDPRIIRDNLPLKELIELAGELRKHEEGLDTLLEQYRHQGSGEYPSEYLTVAIQGPRTVADFNPCPIVVFLDEFQFVRSGDLERYHAVGKYQRAVESFNCPHIVTGSAVTMMARDVVGKGALFMRFRPKYIQGLDGYWAIELFKKLCDYYEVEWTEEVAAQAYAMTAGNPFYMECIVTQARDSHIDLTTIDGLNQAMSRDLTSGNIWRELYLQVEQHTTAINNKGIAKRILYRASLREENEDIYAQDIARELGREGVPVTVEEVERVLHVLAGADIIETSMDETCYRKIKDPVLNEFLRVWARIDLEKRPAREMEAQVTDRYATMQRQFASFKGYVAELFLLYLMKLWKDQSVDGASYFNYPGEVTLPRFIYLDQVRLKPEGKPEEQIDVLGLATHIIWVVESKYQDAPVGPEAIKALEAKGEAVYEEYTRPEREGGIRLEKELWLWCFSKSGFTRSAIEYIEQRRSNGSRILYSDESDLNRMLRDFGVRELPRMENGDLRTFYPGKGER